jgi:hypothetical protein
MASSALLERQRSNTGPPGYETGVRNTALHYTVRSVLVDRSTALYIHHNLHHREDVATSIGLL